MLAWRGPALPEALLPRPCPPHLQQAGGQRLLSGAQAPVVAGWQPGPRPSRAAARSQKGLQEADLCMARPEEVLGAGYAGRLPGLPLPAATCLCRPPSHLSEASREAQSSVKTVAGGGWGVPLTWDHLGGLPLFHGASGPQGWHWAPAPWREWQVGPGGPAAAEGVCTRLLLRIPHSCPPSRGSHGEGMRGAALVCKYGFVPQDRPGRLGPH